MPGWFSDPDIEGMPQWLAAMRAASSLQRAVAYLYYSGDQWLTGEQEAARLAAVDLLDTARRQVQNVYENDLWKRQQRALTRA